MTLRFSTGFRNAVMQKGSWKEFFNECVIYIYTGAQPASADTGATGTLLATITKASGTFTASTLSTRKRDRVKVTVGTATEVYTVTINGTNYTYTMAAADDASAIAEGLVKALRACVDIIPMAVTGETNKCVMVEAKFAGESYSIEVSTTASIGSIVASVELANSRYVGLHWGSVSAGVIAKESAYAWSGSCVAAGAAGYFRISENSDTPANTSTTAIRVDGNIGTSGADLIVGTTTVSIGTPLTIDSGNFTFPSS